MFLGRNVGTDHVLAVFLYCGVLALWPLRNVGNFLIMQQHDSSIKTGYITESSARVYLPPSVNFQHTTSCFDSSLPLTIINS